MLFIKGLYIVEENIYYDIIVNMVIILDVLLAVNVNSKKLNVNSSKCNCTCNIVIFKELILNYLL